METTGGQLQLGYDAIAVNFRTICSSRSQIFSFSKKSEWSQKSFPVRLLSFSLIPIALLSSTRVFTRTDTHTSALPRLTIRILTEYYCTYCT